VKLKKIFFQDTWCRKTANDSYKSRHAFISDWWESQWGTTRVGQALFVLCRP